MKILNFGSLNIDYVFNVDHIVAPGETIDSFSVDVYPGGKGLNQSLAIARAGASAFHAGMIGHDGGSLKALLEQDGVNCTYLRTVAQNTGSAFIQVARNGENSIVLNGGANRANTEEMIVQVLAGFGEGDLVLLQNEINLVGSIIDKAFERKMAIILNPSPMNETIKRCNLDKITLFIMNEYEGQQITGKEDVHSILTAMRTEYPNAGMVLTLGSQGAIYQNDKQEILQEAYRVNAVDTTAAGDTFAGYFIAALTKNKEIPQCLKIASQAAALAVMKRGAASSIPYMKKVVTADLK